MSLVARLRLTMFRIKMTTSDVIPSSSCGLNLARGDLRQRLVAVLVAL